MNASVAETNAETIEKIRIHDVVSKSIVARDSGHWERFAACYHPDAVLKTSWFTGTPAEFIESSKDMKIANHPGESQKHMTSNYAIETNGTRAVSECDLILYQRRLVDGVELDFSTWSRRIDLLEVYRSAWRIWRINVIYEKDRMDPARPDQKLDDFYRSMDLSSYPPQIKYHCWRNHKVGFPPSADICIKGSDREVEVRAEAQRWLAGA